MNISETKSLLDELYAARKVLWELESARANLNFSGHQTSMSAKVGSVTLNVTVMDNAYMQRVKKGYEMIVLGFQKVVNSQIDEQKDEIRKIEELIRNAVNGVKP